MNDDHVVLVDATDNEIATMDKLDAHRPPGFLHRAFSVVVHDAAGRILLQRRASTKYHFAGAWATSCCSHPRPGAHLLDEARRRLREELGLHVDRLDHVGTTIYRAVDPISGLHEHELDHVIVTEIDGRTMIAPNSDEVADIAWATPSDVVSAITADATAFAPWTEPVLRTSLPTLTTQLDRAMQPERVNRWRASELGETTESSASTLAQHVFSHARQSH